MDLGDIVDGRYRLEYLLGRGGMGVVYAATQLALARPVALKLSLHPDGGRARDRLRREARVLARIDSDHVVRVLDVGDLPSGDPFLVMEHLAGTTLRAALATRGPFATWRAAEYVRQACLGIAEAHRVGVVHRDLKLMNLFEARRLDGTRTVKILDFGIASACGEDEARAGEDVMGSLTSLSPEQIAGGPAIDARADVWGLGVALYQLLTGRSPFYGPSALAVVEAILRRAPEPPHVARAGGLPAPLSRALMRCLEKDPRRRFQRVEDLARELEPFAPEPSELEISISVEGDPAALFDRAV